MDSNSPPSPPKGFFDELSELRCVFWGVCGGVGSLSADCLGAVGAGCLCMCLTTLRTGLQTRPRSLDLMKYDDFLFCFLFLPYMLIAFLFRYPF